MGKFISSLKGYVLKEGIDKIVVDNGLHAMSLYRESKIMLTIHIGPKWREMVTAKSIREENWEIYYGAQDQFWLYKSHIKEKNTVDISVVDVERERRYNEKFNEVPIDFTYTHPNPVGHYTQEDNYDDDFDVRNFEGYNPDLDWDQQGIEFWNNF